MSYISKDKFQKINSDVLGEGRQIIDSRGNTYEQYKGIDGLTLRLFNGPCLDIGSYTSTEITLQDDFDSEYDDTTTDYPYKGIIFKRDMSKNDESFEIYKKHSERLSILAGKSIEKSRGFFNAFISSHHLIPSIISHPMGIEIIHNKEDFINPRIGPEICSKEYAKKYGKVHERNDYPISIKDWIKLNNRSSILDIQGLTKRDPYNLEALSFLDKIGLRKDPSAKLKEAFTDPDFVLDSLESSYKNQNEEGIRHYLRIMRELFPATKYYKGYVVTYINPDKDKVIAFLNYLVNGKDMPSLPQVMEKTKEEKIESSFSSELKKIPFMRTASDLTNYLGSRR